MRRFQLALLPLMLLACRRPDVEAFGRKPLPVVVSMSVPSDQSNAESVRDEYAAALRAKLATCITVVPEGVTAPSASAELKVAIHRIYAHRDPSPGAIGTATGVAVGTLSLLAGDRDAFFSGLFWGLWAGSAAADSQIHTYGKLGYAPARVSASVTLQTVGQTRPLAHFTIRSGEVIEQMETLQPPDRYDPARIREAEAKAFAAVVVSRLQERFHWLPLPEPSYFEWDRLDPELLPAP